MITNSIYCLSETKQTSFYKILFTSKTNSFFPLRLFCVHGVVDEEKGKAASPPKGCGSQRTNLNLKGDPHRSRF